MSKSLFVINAVVAVAFGLFMVFVPDKGLAQFNMTARVQEVFMARAFGAAMAALGILLWFAKDGDETLQRRFSMAALAGSLLGLIVTVIGITGVVKGFGWVAIIVEVVFALGYAFVLFIQPRVK